MEGSPLNSFVAVPVSSELYAELMRRHSGRVSTTVENVVWDFLDRTADDFNARGEAKDGVRWEALFIRDGTEIRTKYFGEYKVAKVQDGSIVWGERTFSSMSQLARAMRGNTSNNAWRVLEIKRPGDAEWRLADLLRQ